MTQAKGLLLVLVDPAPNHQDELNAWYDTEHLPERSVLPGFLTAQRFTATEGGPRYLALYDLEGIEALNSPQYQAISGPNFSPWTRRVTSLSKTVRIAARQILPNAQATGPCTRLLLLRFASGAAEDMALIEAGLQQSYAGSPALGQYRIFHTEEPDPMAVIAIVEIFGNAVPPLQLAAFGRTAARIEMATTYQPYRR